LFVFKQKVYNYDYLSEAAREYSRSTYIEDLYIGEFAINKRFKDPRRILHNVQSGFFKVGFPTTHLPVGGVGTPL
jgi:hypothetical protein